MIGAVYRPIAPVYLPASSKPGHTSKAGYTSRYLRFPFLWFDWSLYHMAMHLPRLTEPLVRENGSLRPASWEEALDRAADGFRQVKARYGGDAIGTFSCSKASNEVNFLAQKLARVAFGTHNVDSCNRT